MFAADRAQSYLSSLAERLQRVAAGATLEVVGTPPGRSGAYNPLTPDAVVDRAARAAADGCDAFLIGNITDPGCAEAQAGVHIPVLGLGEASVRTACQMGGRFGSISSDRQLGVAFERVVDRLGAREQFAGTVLMPANARATPDELLDAFADESRSATLLAAWAAAARRAVGSGRAQTLIPTGGVVMEMLSRAGISQVESATILDGPALLVSLAERAVADRERAHVSRVNPDFTPSGS
jgi:Asp/Glu/hydantoin racemase